MVPTQPALVGSFAPTLSPVVEIDALDPNNPKPAVPTVVATYTTTSGVGSKTVVVDGNHYQVNWNTALFKLDSTHIYEVKVSLGSTQLGVADVVLDQPNVDRTKFVPLANGSTLQIKFWLNGCAQVVCTADLCHVPGTCDPVTAQCSAPTAKPDWTDCNNGNLCTNNYCQAGVCTQMKPPTTCGPPGDACNFTCNPTTGACSIPPPGGPCPTPPPGAPPGGPCMIDLDCQSGGVCVMGVCQAGMSGGPPPPPPTCTIDGIKDGSETDVDCGGGACPPCATGKACRGQGDCQSAVCGMGICQAPTCTDGVKNGAETDTDCGGGTCPACAAGKQCKANTDCVSVMCNGGVCS
jgi:hypothetical protein